MWRNCPSLELKDGLKRIKERDGIGYSEQIRRAMANMLTLAKAMKPIADRWDADPWLLGVPNGVVDLRTGALRPGHLDDRITMQAGTLSDPDAQGPRWAQFIQEIFAGDQSLVDFVWRSIGYSLTGVTTEQVHFLSYGTGANGKPMRDFRDACIGACLQLFGEEWLIELARERTADRDMAFGDGRRNSPECFPCVRSGFKESPV